LARKRRRGRREGGPADVAPEADDPEPPEVAPARRVAERRAALVGEFLRYCVISGLLLAFAPGLGAIVAIFWGIGLARRAYAEFAVPALERRWTERELERRAHGGERRLGRGGAGAEAPPRTALQLGALVEAALASRSERLSARGVALRHEGACEAPVKGDAELLARAVDALLDAAEEDLGARGDPRRLDVELGCSLDGSEAWLRLRSRGGGAGAEPSALGGARRVAEAHGGRLEVNASAAGGLEQVLTLPTAEG
jgi:hypothetical protein